MGKFRIEITTKARKDLERHYHSGNKANIRKIAVIFNELTQHPYTGTGKPEQLKYKLSGFWSRRINQTDHLVYSVSENTVTVEVVSAIGHYEQ